MVNFRRPLDRNPTTIWNIAHNLQSDLDYLLEQQNFSPSAVMHPHALKMILKHIIRELDDIKQIAKND